MSNTTTALYAGAALESARHAEAHRMKANEATLQLASGKRQVTAAKDTSSVAISSQIESLVRVIDQAKINAKNAASVIQVATGALNNIKDLLTTMDALAAKSNSGDADDNSRIMMNKEFTQLRDQVTDIANRTRWNGVSLLGGSASTASYGAATAVTAAGANVVLSDASNGGFIAGLTASSGYITGTADSVSVTSKGAGYDVDIVVGGQTFRASNFVPANSAAVKFISTIDSGNTITLTTDTGAGAALTTAAIIKTKLETTLGITAASLNASFTSDSIAPGTAVNGFTPNTGIAVSASTTGGEYALSYAANSNKLHLTSANFSEDVTVAAGAQTVSFSNGIKVTTASGFALGTAIGQFAFKVDTSNSTSLTFQVGEKAADTMNATFNAATGAALGISTQTVDTAANAVTASGKIKDALISVNQLYSTLGALQGRLESTIVNLGVTSENLSAAKSNYSDTDVADSITRQTVYTIATEMANIGVGKALQINQQLLKLAQQA